MATITFTYSSNTGSVVNAITAPLRATIKQLSGMKRTLSFQYGPQGISYDGLGLEYSTIDRPGLSPLLQATSKKQRTVNVTAILARSSDGGRSSIEGQLGVLKAMAEEDDDLSFTYGVSALPYRVRLTSLSYTSIQRDLDGNITQAEVTLQLDEHVIFSQSVVTLNAIAYAPDPVSSSATKTAGSGTTAQKKNPVDNGVDIRVNVTDTLKPVPGRNVAG